MDGIYPFFAKQGYARRKKAWLKISSENGTTYPLQIPSIALTTLRPRGTMVVNEGMEELVDSVDLGDVTLEKIL